MIYGLRGFRGLSILVFGSFLIGYVIDSDKCVAIVYGSRLLFFFYHSIICVLMSPKLVFFCIVFNIKNTLLKIVIKLLTGINSIFNKRGMRLRSYIKQTVITDIKLSARSNYYGLDSLGKLYPFGTLIRATLRSFVIIWAKKGCRKPIINF